MKKSNKKSKAVAKRSSKAADTVAAQQIKNTAASLQRLLVSRLQIIASILASISWSPDVPQFLIEVLRFITNIFSVNVPGLLTSADCGGGMTPIEKWYFGMFIPFGILFVFGLWYCCLPSKSIAKSTVKEASVQVGFVWLFVTIVTSSLKIFDCDDSGAVSTRHGRARVSTLVMDLSLH